MTQPPVVELVETTAITRLLVANRAEIASRVFRTCRRLGLETVAVHSDADTTLPYVREADIAVRLPGNAPAETYLRIDLVIAVARKAGADAIHPGYGFLSENAEFARAVIDAGLVWVGPAPASIEAMGSKVAAKKLMESAGVPVLGSLAVDTATEADLPLIVKASAGGGGRGMRIVRTLTELPDQVAAASAEAGNAFGDPTVFVEPYVEHVRHVEVQVVGHSGGLLVLGERDCSLQRRHQKVVEEAPAPGLSDQVRSALREAAEAAAAAIDYKGAGTVEFLVDADDPSRFWFLEMNTRLQVEHPVTEAVFGVDLVELQLAVAEGRVISTSSISEERSITEGGSITEERSITEPRGHAIEARLYAEDPGAGYQPQSGVLSRFEIPEGDGIRVDAGVETGSEVSTHYDAMLAKVVAHAPTREQAARQLASVLSRSRIHGVTTNRDLLVRVLRSERFLDGDLTTDFLTGSVLLDDPASADAGAHIAAAIAQAERCRLARTVQRSIPVAWRNVVSQRQSTMFTTSRGEDLRVEWLAGRDGYVADGVLVVSASPEVVVLDRDSVRTSYDVAVAGDFVYVDWPSGHVALTVIPKFTDPADQVASGSLLAPMPGTVVRVEVVAGQRVEAGQAVLVLEAMKMQHTVAAPHAGTVAGLPVVAGQQVTAGDVLAVVQEEDA